MDLLVVVELDRLVLLWDDEGLVGGEGDDERREQQDGAYLHRLPALVVPESHRWKVFRRRIKVSLPGYSF